ncbi:Uma2 family endonuclease [uncultured Lamprocystis sp.]|jgi:Uma2 family endonuclease|uniref:Uma2 family endonuclease n=1 Tax=uncultured Lamprocystis sp. TaxID=543132 RepID=UPI0025D6C62B|nr:Uma2 family endonuclease [uncultured Lamprocystis sp.]
MSATAEIRARVHRLTVDDYRRMGALGILGPELRTELIDGEIIELPPIGQPYAGSAALIADRLREAVERSAVVALHEPIGLDDHCEPRPDIALLRPGIDGARAERADVLLLIEVADGSLRYDREVKLPRYARAGIPEAWLVDLGGRRLTIHRRPGPHGYADVMTPSGLGAVPLPLAGLQTADLSGLF